MAASSSRRKWRGSVGVSVLAAIAISAMFETVVLCDQVQELEDALGNPPPIVDGRPLPPELDPGSPFNHDTITAVASNVNNAFVSSMTRQEFAVLNPDDIVAGSGTTEMLPKAEIHISGSSKEHGMLALRHANLPESQSRDYMRTIFIREPEGSILNFINTGVTSRCPARNYGIRALVTDVKADESVIIIKYQQYDAGGHIFIDEVGEAKVLRGNFIRVALGFDTVGAGSLVTFMCKDYGEPIYVYVGWPSHIPVFRMDEEWSLPVKVVRMTTLKGSDGLTTVVGVLQHPGPPSDKVVDPITHQPVKGPFLYVGAADASSRAFGAFAEMLEGTICTLTAFLGNRRPELHCNVDDIHFPEENLKKAGTARKVKIATAVLAALMSVAGFLMFLRGGKTRKASALPGVLAAANAAGAIGSKVIENKQNEKVLQLIKPKVPVDHEHLVFIQADQLPPPTEQENEARKVKLLLDMAEEKRKEEEEEERKQ